MLTKEDKQDVEEIVNRVVDRNSEMMMGFMLQHLGSIRSELREFKEHTHRKFQEHTEILQLIVADAHEMKQDISGLKQDVSDLKQDVSDLKQDVSDLKQDVSILKDGQANIQGHFENFTKFTVDNLMSQREEINALKKLRQ